MYLSMNVIKFSDIFMDYFKLVCKKDLMKKLLKIRIKRLVQESRCSTDTISEVAPVRDKKHRPAFKVFLTYYNDKNNRVNYMITLFT